MFPLPDGTLTYINIDHSVVCSVLSGLFLLPIPFALLLLLFWCWREDLWFDQQEQIQVLKEKGFVSLGRSFWPRWVFMRQGDRVVLYRTPIYSWISIKMAGGILKRVEIGGVDLKQIIGSLDPQESTSKPQKL